MNIWKLIKVQTFTDTSFKVRNVNQFVIRLFLMLDSARTKYTFKLREGMHVIWLKPSLKKQVKCILPSISV